MLPATAPQQRRALFQQLEPEVLLQFSFRNVLRQPRALLNSLTSKSVSGAEAFLKFGLQMCFAPQPRELLEYFNFQERPELRCFQHFDLEMFFAR